MAYNALHGLSRVLEDISGQTTDQSTVAERLGTLAESLHRHTPLKAVRIRLASLTEAGGVANGLAATTIDCPIARADEKILNPRNYLDDVSRASEDSAAGHILLDGANAGIDNAFTNNCKCLLLRVVLLEGICWVGLIGEVEVFQDLSPWLELLPGLLRMCGHRRDIARQRRQRLYQQILANGQLTTADAHLTDLCQAWDELSGADWCWLWLYNPITKTFELTAHYPDRKDVLPAERIAPGPKSAAALALHLQKPLRVEDMSWRQDREANTHSVECRQTLAQMGCEVFYVIPVLSGTRVPSLASDSATDVAAPTGLNAPIAGVISLMSKNPQFRLDQPEASLMLMGRLTAQAIESFQVGQQRDLLVMLNDLEQRCLTRTERTTETRARYLDEIIRLIRDKLSVDAVSIFFRTSFGEQVECLASTGLMQVEGKQPPYPRVQVADYKKVIYRRNEGRTGTCFTSGQTKILIEYSEVEKSPGKYWEHTPQGERAFPCVLHPILAPGNLPHPTGPALGVIRCAGHRAPRFPLQRRGVTLVELQTLDFIARQIAPVLLILESQIQREHIINVVKHDLENPLNLIRNIAEKISEQVSTGAPIDSYDLKNLEVAQLLGTKLVDQLDPDVTAIRAYAPRFTFLEREVVAPLAKMLGHYAEAEKCMKIRFYNVRSLPALNVDPILIERVLSNLLMNAIKYGTDRSLIEVYAREDESGYYLDISNYGLGVEEEESPYLFQAYYRSPRAKKKAMGLGLGLYISKQAMMAHGGGLKLTHLKNPTTFTMFIPKKA